MNPKLHLTILAEDEQTIRALADRPLVLANADRREAVAVDGPRHVPGAMGGWYELALQVGVVSLPAGIVASCLATWIMEARSAQPESEKLRSAAKLVIQRGDSVAEVVLVADSAADLGTAIRNAMEHADSQ